MKINIFIPCWIDQFYPQTGLNMVKVLEKLGCEVHYNPNQTCCGQSALEAGVLKEAQLIAEKFLKDFSENDDLIVVPSAACVATVRNRYTELLDKNAQKELYNLSNRIFELSEFIVDVLEITEIDGAKLSGTATYLDNCQALRSCAISEAPRTLLKNIGDLTLIEMPESQTCCGFGAGFAVNFPAMATTLAEQKIDNANLTQADFIISTDYTCLMHLEGYIKRNRKSIQVLHLADVLASGW